MTIMEFCIYYWQELPFHPPGLGHGLKQCMRKWWLLLYKESSMAQCWKEINIFPGVAIKLSWKKLLLNFCSVAELLVLGFLSFRVQSHICASESRAGCSLPCCQPGSDQACKWRWQMEDGDVSGSRETSLAVNPNLARNSSSCSKAASPALTDSVPLNAPQLSHP